MEEILNYTDIYRNEPHQKIYTSRELGIPGLNVLGKIKTHSLNPPSQSHFHQDRIEIMLVVNGYKIVFANGKEYRLRGGDIFVTPVNIPHSSGTLPKGIHEMFWFQLLVGKPSFLFLDKNWADKLQLQLRNMELGIYRGLYLSRKYLSEMFSLLISDSPMNKYQGVSQLVNLLHKIVDIKPNIQDFQSYDIQKSINVIQTNIHKEILLEDLADETGLSLTRFKEKFQEHVGMSPRLYINTQKVEMSKKLLIEGKNITDVAFEMGFNSSTYFSTVFRKFTRQSPGEFVRTKGS